MQISTSETKTETTGAGGMVPGRAALLGKSMVRGLIMSAVVRYFPEFAKDPAVNIGIDMAVVVVLELIRGWISSTVTLKTAANAAIDAMNIAVEATELAKGAGQPRVGIPIGLPTDGNGMEMMVKGVGAGFCEVCGSATGFAGGPTDPKYCSRPCMVRAGVVRDGVGDAETKG